MLLMMDQLISCFLGICLQLKLQEYIYLVISKFSMEFGENRNMLGILTYNPGIKFLLVSHSVEKNIAERICTLDTFET